MPAPAEPIRPPALLVMRSDLIVAPYDQSGGPMWTLKDPLTLRYTQVTEEELAILQLLDGRSSFVELQRRFNQRFAPRHIELERLESFLAEAHRQELVVSLAAGQGGVLIDREVRRRRVERMSSWMKILALRFRGFDPGFFVDLATKLLRPMFTRWFALVVCLAGGMVTGEIAIRWQSVQAKLPEFDAFFAGQNIGWFLLAIALVKVIHELAHAAMCRRFGGECHEVGLMLLLFTPTLYCDVSDAWLFSSKWRRIAVSAAGMYAEVCIAITAAAIWLAIEPGAFSTLLLALIFVCSVSTLLVNGNPLLRYDGYYIFSDLVGVPNLYESAQRSLREFASHWIFGMTPNPSHRLTTNTPRWLSFYAIAAIAYRLALIAAMVWFLRKTLLPYRLELLATIVAAVAIAAFLTPGIAAAVRTFRNPIWRRQLRYGQVGFMLGLLAMLLGVALFIPLPRRVYAPAVIEPIAAARIYVAAGGTIEQAIQPGVTIQSGERLATLRSNELAWAVARLEGEVREQTAYELGLRLRRDDDAVAERRIPAAQERLTDLRRQLEQRKQDAARLIITAPTSGVALPPPKVTPPATRGQLAKWSGSPLDERNRGAYLEPGSLLCLIGDPESVEATLVVEQSDVPLVGEGEQVELRMAQWPGQTILGTVRQIARADLDQLPKQFLGGGDIATRTDPSGAIVPLETLYLVRVALAKDHPRLILGARGEARIECAKASLASRAIRYLEKLFRFESGSRLSANAQ